jgi:predicted transcriptional regulator
MRLDKVREILDADILVGEEFIDLEVVSACGSDLMSDVLAFVKDQTLLLTGLINPQVVRTAEMMDIRVIVFVRGKVPGKEIVQLAKEKDMVLLTTKYPLYTACGLLYSAGLHTKEV